MCYLGVALISVQRGKLTEQEVQHAGDLQALQARIRDLEATIDYMHGKLQRAKAKRAAVAKTLQDTIAAYERQLEALRHAHAEEVQRLLDEIEQLKVRMGDDGLLLADWSATMWALCLYGTCSLRSRPCCERTLIYARHLGTKT